MMAQVNAGRVRFVGRGEYNNSTQYYVFDLVSYNGNSYYAKVDTIGNLPTNTTYWQLVAEKGNVGPIGLTGNGISSITKTGTSGLVDTYTITFTNGNTTTFDVTNGNGIDRIEKTATVGNIDTYTIYFNDNSTSTFEVANGEVTREELEEEVDRLSMIYNLFPTTSDEDTEMTLDGTGEVKLKKIGLKGNTYQKTRILPSEYTQVDYITGDGTAYINTGKTLGTNFIIKTTFIHNQRVNHEQAVFSTWSDDYKWFNTYITADSNTCRTHVLGNYYPTSNLLTIGDKNDVIISRNGNDWRFTLNNQYVDFARSEISTTNSNPLTLFKRADLLGSSAYISIYETKLFEGDVLTMDLIPCYRNSDNEVGMYDIIGNAFYTNSASTGAFIYGSVITIPNPDYPQDVQVVSGDNSINVCGKNLFDKSKISTGYLKEDATLSTDAAYRTSDFMPIQPNTTYYKTSTGSPRTKYFDINKVPLNTTTYWDVPTGGSAGTFITPNNAYYLRLSFPFIGSSAIDIDTIMVKEGTDTTYEEYKGQSYPISLGDIELCKIGTYQDSIKKSTGKNLYGTAIKTDSITGSSYTIITDTSDKLEIQGISSFYSGIYKKYQLQSNTQYTISLKYSELGSKSRARIYYKLGNDRENITVNDNNGYIDIGTTRTSLTFTTDSTGLVVIMFMCNFDTNSGYVVYNDIQLEKGNSSSDYEPYGKVWYLNKQIGKVVLDGSEDWATGQYGTYSYGLNIVGMKPSINDTNNPIYVATNLFKGVSYNDRTTAGNNITYSETNFGDTNLYIRNTSYTSLANFKTMLGTTNLIVYYVLATPTYTEITDTTLIEQLDNLENAYSYDTQTNITQTNDDMPFILDVEAILSLKGVLN